ncbi:Ppp1r7 [Nucleospora cyclopteri]
MDKFDESKCCFHVNKRDEKLVINRDVQAAELRRNQFEAIPEEIPDTIEYLDLSDNLIKKVNSERFTEIKVLDLGYNLLQEHDCIKNDSLEELYLMANDIQHISSSIKHLKRLKKIDIASNRILNADIIADLPLSIEEIYLGANKINRFNCDLSHLINLKILDLQFNDLTEINVDLLPSNLHTLLLNDNPNLKNLFNLKKDFKILDLLNTKVAKKEN